MTNKERKSSSKQPCHPLPPSVFVRAQVIAGVCCRPLKHRVVVSWITIEAVVMNDSFLRKGDPCSGSTPVSSLAFRTRAVYSIASARVASVHLSTRSKADPSYPHFRRSPAVQWRIPPRRLGGKVVDSKRAEILAERSRSQP